MTTIKDILKFKDGRALDVKFPIVLKDANGNVTYFEASNGYWFRCEYDADGNKTYYEDSNGFWNKNEYDADGNQTYSEDSDGFWCRREYDAGGNQTYFEVSDGFWCRREYGADGNETYYEDSYGYEYGTPSSDKVKITVEGKTIEISKESAKTLGLIK